MRKAKVCALLLCIGLLLVVLTPGAKASDLDKKTFVTFAVPVELPGGMVLQPGEYTMKVVPLASTLNVVQILNKDGTEVYSTFWTFSTERTEPTSETMVVLREARVGMPRPMEVWFYPGSRIGWEFPMPKK